MGMTIETAIRNLSMYDVNECGNAELHTWYKDIDKDMEESFKVAINTMHKYQKIAHLINQAEYAGENSYTGEDEWILVDKTYQKIQEIFRNENVD